MSSNSSNLRVALLGAGGRGRAVLRSWIEVTDCDVVAVVDPSAESLEKTRAFISRTHAEKLIDTEFTTDVDGWLGRAKGAGVDLVTINSWDPQHAENAIACFEAGLNIQVAKPMAQTIEDADRVVEAWEQSGCIGVVDMQIRTSALATKAMELINAGALGTVRLIQCFDYVGRSGVEFRSTRSRRRDMIKSWTLAKGVHFTDLMNMFAGSEPRRVFAFGGRSVFGGDKPNDLTCDQCDVRDTCEFEGTRTVIGGMPFPKANSGCVFTRETDITDHTVAVVEYANGVRASYTECFFTPEYQTTYEIVGEKGALFVRYAMDHRLYVEYRPRATANREHIDVYTSGAHGGGDVAIVKQIAAALREGRHIQPDIRDGRNAVAVCEAIDRSVDEGAVIDIAPSATNDSSDASKPKMSTTA